MKSMAKKWISKRRYLVWLSMVVAVFVSGLMGCGSADSEAVAEWGKVSVTTVASQIYQDSAGNEIAYYCCKTTYYEEAAIPEVGTLDRQALSAVIDLDELDQVSGVRECTVGEWPALQCKKGERDYLCWTISPEYSCVIEYDADAVSEEDIFRMAESVMQQ